MSCEEGQLDEDIKAQVDRIFRLLIKAGLTSQEARAALFMLAHEGECFTNELAEVAEEYQTEQETNLILSRLKEVME